MNFNERYLLLKAHAAKMQFNAHLLWLLREREKELRGTIADNNPVLASGRKVITERMEVMRVTQIEMIKQLNFISAAIQEAQNEKVILWQEFTKI
jgi:limonene-1,2-epoxide hydrolase